ncbi:nuclease-related domain-containing protein [Bacillus sp. 2205SS5-2]|uniref:nuclease-related domain-containing protein n=1 Tax=Bacillus sp. 2205SS5-2 TaxID=3109031 RepID=UPI003003FFBD
MAQLLKLQDYVSRYEMDLYRYPSQFVRLKKQQWDKTYQTWELGEKHHLLQRLENLPTVSPERTFFRKFKSYFSKGKEIERTLFDQRDMEADEGFTFETSFHTLPVEEDELKKHFLDQLFQFQMKWASSTLTEKSYIDSSYYRDDNLRYLLQRFPDTYLVFYNPVLQLKNAPVELEILVLTPKELICITMLESNDGTAYIGSNERFWIEKYKDREKKILNPVISLNRMEKIIKNILSIHSVDLPVKKLILSRNGFLDYPSAPYHVELVDQRKYPQWFEEMRMFRSPLKNVQIRAAQAVLSYCQTTSFKRLEWDNDEDRDFSKGD